PLPRAAFTRDPRCASASPFLTLPVEVFAQLGLEILPPGLGAVALGDATQHRGGPGPPVTDEGGIAVVPLHELTLLRAAVVRVPHRETTAVIEADLEAAFEVGAADRLDHVAHGLVG